MVRVIKMFTEEYWRALESTPFTTMGGSPTHKAMTSAEEQISICIRELGENIKSITVDG
jgi:hypothetical protein